MPLYWGEVIPTQHNVPAFVVSSRLHGTLLIYNWSTGEAEAVAGAGPGLAKSITSIELPDKAISFNKPVLWKSKSVAIICGTDRVLSIDISGQHSEMATKETKLESPISLLKGFKSQPDLLLIGTELKDLHLINSQTSQVLSTIHLADEIDKSTASKIPTYTTSCDGDESTGFFAVGTSSHVHVIKIDFGTSDSKAAKLSIEATLTLSTPGVGVSHVLLHPNKKLVAVASWDFTLQIYSFPEMVRIHKCVSNANQGIVSLHFVTSTEVDVDGDEDPDVKRNFDTKQDLVYLAASTPDGCIRVWNLSGW